MIITKRPESELQPIQFKKIQMDLNLTPGSKQSLDFHKMLSETECKEIFKTVAIKNILKYKWEQSKTLARFIAFMDFSAFVVFTIMHQPFIFNENAYFYPFFVVFIALGAYLTFFELVQIATKDSLITYFQDIFNLCDVVKYTSMWMYIFTILSGHGA